MPGETPGIKRSKPRVFIDADVLFAGSAAPSEHSASLVVLRMAEITLVEAYTCQQVIAEAERNLVAKLPHALPAFRLIVARSLHVVSDSGVQEIQLIAGFANPIDLPILAAALKNDCPWLITLNTLHYQPGLPAVTVLTPENFLLRVRDLLARLG